MNPLSPTQQREAIGSILNKFGQFLMAPPIRDFVGQVRTKLDFAQLMDDSCIFIANLAKARIGEHNSMLLGSLVLTKFFLAALRRADRPEHDRRDFFISADEIHNLAMDMIAALYSEARKYHLSLTGATQYLNQLSPAIRSAIFGNVGTIVTFRRLFVEGRAHCGLAGFEKAGGKDGWSQRTKCENKA
jgi:type IV secretory pathway TraG/TraD family ATPase VirD4